MIVSQDDQNKQAVHLIYPCFLCEVILDEEQTILAHMNDTHGYHIPPRSPESKRPLDEMFSFKQDLSGQERYACPSCWFHCESGNMRFLRLHTVQEHPYEGHDSDSDHTEINVEQTDENKGFIEENKELTVENRNNETEPPDLQKQKREFLVHFLAELDNLNLFLKDFMS